MKPDWATMEHEDRLAGITAGKQAGKSAREIAFDLGAPSRDAILGYVYRHMVPDRERAKRWDKRALKPCGPAPVVKARLVVERVDRPPARALKTRKLPKLREIPVVATKALTERRMGFECAWVIGDPREPDVQCCGAPTAMGASWCAAHREIVFG